MNWKLIEDKSWCSLEQLFEWVREMNTVQQDIRYHAEGSVAKQVIHDTGLKMQSVPGYGMEQDNPGIK